MINMSCNVSCRYNVVIKANDSEYKISLSLVARRGQARESHVDRQRSRNREFEAKNGSMTCQNRIIVIHRLCLLFLVSMQVRYKKWKDTLLLLDLICAVSAFEDSTELYFPFVAVIATSS